MNVVFLFVFRVLRANRFYKFRVQHFDSNLRSSGFFYSGGVGEGAPFSAVLLLEKKRRLSVFCWDDGSKCLFERCVYGTI